MKFPPINNILGIIALPFLAVAFVLIYPILLIAVYINYRKENKNETSN